MNSLAKEKLLLLSIGFFANFPVQFVGVLRLGEIIGLLYILFHLPSLTRLISLNRHIKYYTLLTAFWLILAFMSSVINDTSNLDIQKGLANIIFLYTTFIAFFMLFEKNLSLILYFLITYAIGSLFFSPYSYAIGSVLDISTEISNGTFGNAFDIFVVPVIMPLLMVILILIPRKSFWIILLTLSFGLISIYFDAKSVGFVFILTALVYFLKTVNYRLSTYTIYLYLLIFPFIFLPVLSSLIANNLLGSASSGQLSEIVENTDKYNPFTFFGRSHTIVGILAVADQPLWGHGFNKQDPGYFQLAISMGFLPLNSYYRFNDIPSHSILIGTMIQGGVLSSLIWFYCFSVTVKALSTMFEVKKNPFSIFICIAFFLIFWNILFSAIARTDLGYLLAFTTLFTSFYERRSSGQYHARQKLVIRERWIPSKNPSLIWRSK